MLRMLPLMSLFAALTCCSGLTIRSTDAAELQLKPGDHICLVGNELGERMQHHNFWEAKLHQRFAKHNLVVRNLCFPGDEPLNRLRSLNFGSPDKHLTHSKASVILFFFGFNESFKGEHGLKKFEQNLTKLITETKAKNYSGKGAPRMVLISPIAVEQIPREATRGLADNKNLALYAKAMQRVAKSSGVGFVDLFTPTKRLFESSKFRQTYNGVHLSADGYKALAPMLMHGLFDPPKNQPELPDGLMKEIANKNFHWWHRYRAVNGYSIYGKRGLAGASGDGKVNNRDVMERERAILDQMVANRDKRIWAVAQHKKVAAKVDDSNTLPFYKVKTNVGGPKDPNRKRGKLGDLEYISAKEQIKFFKLPKGYVIELVASEEQFPELANPVSMNFDAKGRLWVTVMPSYPQWQPKTKMDDKLLILEDKNGDGKADVCKTFAGGLHQPTGFELGNGGVYIAQQPDILFLKDSDGDDKADVRIRRLAGFDTADSHHGLAAFEWGPGGGLYFQEGTFKQSQVETPYGPRRLGDAGVWRFQPRGGRLDVHVSFAFANPWGHVFDRWGQNFIADASPGFNYWAAPITGHVNHPDKHPGGGRGGRLDFGGSKSNKKYPRFIRKRIRPSSGCEIVSSRNFPKEAQGNFLVNNVIGELAILQHKVGADGSGFKGKEIEHLVICKHGNFRPVDLQFGPDGALYIVDWHNALIGHLQHNLRDPSRDHSHGRIWRIRYAERPLVKPPKIAGESVPQLLDLLKSYEDRTRYRVRRELAARKTSDVLPAVEKWLKELAATDKQFEHNLLEALWVYQTHNKVNETLLKRLLNARNFRARAAAVRVLSYWQHRVPHSLALLRTAVNDKHPRVRVEAVRALSFHHKPEAIEATLDALNHDRDVYLDYIIDETIRVLQEELVGSAPAGHAHHGHPMGHSPSASGRGPSALAPIVFLNKSPQVVAYQLARLNATQLLAIKTDDKDAKFKPIHTAILQTPGISRQDRNAAADALAKLNKTNPVSELLDAIGRLDGRDRKQRDVIRQLSGILLRQPAGELKKHLKTFQQSARANDAELRTVAFAGLISAGNADDAWKSASRSPAGRQSFLNAVPMLPSSKTRASLRTRVIESLANSQPLAVRRAAITALGYVPANQKDSFDRVAAFVKNGRLRSVAVATLTRIPKSHRTQKSSAAIVAYLVTMAEKTPARRRTRPAFLDAMHLADELLAVLPAGDAKKYRARLREVVVRVVRINTVHEEMRYDTPYFVVEAGRPVQLVLRNEDLMPHNLVITAPGKLKAVAFAAAGMPPRIDRSGRQFVPKTKDVLFSTKMVPSHEQGVLTFTAPKKPGLYPYVCTFPNHWMRMYGVMVVTNDLDKWTANPVPPPDPLGLKRKFVRKWSLDDFEGDLDSAIAKQDAKVGQRIFQEATCILCHKIGKTGRAVGADLTGAFQRHKGSSRAVLESILDPSKKVDPKYALYTIVTSAGKSVSGIITKRDRNAITVVSNPQNPKPQTISREDVDIMKKSSVSMMPKGILDRHTRDEILALLAYLKSVAVDKAPTP